MCRVPARTEDTTTSAAVVVSPVRVCAQRNVSFGPGSRASHHSNATPIRRPGEALRYAQSGSTVTPRVRPRATACHAAPGPGELADAGRSPQLARRPQPGAGRPHFAFPATTASAAAARGCALTTTRISRALRPRHAHFRWCTRKPCASPSPHPRVARGERPCDPRCARFPD
jgi:hypothetical protein